MNIVGLKVEGREHPLGVDCLTPGFGWSYRSQGERSVIQSAYRIRVYKIQEQEEAEVWDSGRQPGRRHTCIAYSGAPLESATRYYWRVKVWDREGNLWESALSWWETGLLHAHDWKARWIGAPEGMTAPDSPLPLLRREFAVRKPLRRARAYVSGLGHYELRLNGAKIGDRELEPGWTHYDRTCLYSVYDITDQLAIGVNAAGMMLGNGFYNVSGGRYTKFKNSFGLPKCLVQLELYYTDGTNDTVASDGSWSACEGPITFACIYGGEDYDARREQAGWDRPGFAAAAGGKGWAAAAETAAPLGTLRVQQAQPLKVKCRFRPEKATQTAPGVWLIDLGQNFSGWTEIAVSGPAGAEIILTPCERLKGSGPDQRMSGAPYRLTYTLKGEGVEVWRPRFTYYGFRYVQVEGAEPLPDGPEDTGTVTDLADAAEPGMDQALRRGAALASGRAVLLGIEGQMIYPDVAEKGSFECSDHMINRIHEIINWAVLSNMKSVFTDCPHREKLGWLEQLHLMGPSVMYNYDVETIFSKVMEDIRDAQQPSGMIPTTAPEYIVFQPPWDMFRDSVSWGAAYIISNWDLLLQYGNPGSMRTHYPGMKRYAEYMASKMVDGLIMHGLGDWYDVGEDGPGFAQNTPVPLVETAIFYQMAAILEEMAGILDQQEDGAYFQQLKLALAQAFNAEYFNPDTGHYAGGSQTANALPLVLGLAEADNREGILGAIVRDIEERGWHTNAGDVGHRYVLKALSDNGRSDIIYRMTRQTDHPSYGYQIANGATTLTEAWDGPTVGKSQNHFMLGHIEGWFYQGLAGITTRFDREEQAFRITVKPAVVGDLSHVSGHCFTPAGQTAVRWERCGENGFRMTVDIPVNTDALVYVPAVSAESARETGRDGNPAAREVTQVSYEDGYALYAVGSGTYIFESIITAAQPHRMEQSGHSFSP